MIVPAREFSPEIALLVGDLRLGDRGNRNILDEHMRRHRDERLDPGIGDRAGNRLGNRDGDHETDLAQALQGDIGLQHDREVEIAGW